MGLHVQLDVEYASDPKMIDAGPMGELLYVRALCFAKKRPDDGRLTRSQLTRFAAGIPSPLKHAQRLVEVGLWAETDDGWQIAAWLKRNKSAARIAKEQEAKRLKSLLGNHERWHVKEGKYDPTCELCNPYSDPRGDATRETHVDPNSKSHRNSHRQSQSHTEPEEEEEASPLHPLTDTLISRDDADSADGLITLDTYRRAAP